MFSASRTHSDVAPDSASDGSILHPLLWVLGLSTTAEFSINPVMCCYYYKMADVCIWCSDDSWESDGELGRNDQSGGALWRKQRVWDQEGHGHCCASRNGVLHWPDHRWTPLTIEIFVCVLPSKHLILSLFLPVQEMAELMEALPSSSSALPVVTAWFHPPTTLQ